MGSKLIQILKTLSPSNIGLSVVIGILGFLLFKEKTKTPPTPQIVYQEKIVYKEKEEVKAKVAGTTQKHSVKNPDGSVVTDETGTFSADVSKLWEMMDEHEKILSLVRPEPSYSYGMFYHLRDKERDPRLEGVLGANLHKFIDLDLLDNVFLKLKADVDPTKPFNPVGMAVGLEINR